MPSDRSTSWATSSGSASPSVCRTMAAAASSFSGPTATVVTSPARSGPPGREVTSSPMGALVWPMIRCNSLRVEGSASCTSSTTRRNGVAALIVSMRPVSTDSVSSWSCSGSRSPGALIPRSEASTATPVSGSMPVGTSWASRSRSRSTVSTELVVSMPRSPRRAVTTGWNGTWRRSAEQLSTVDRPPDA
jgi:hypothetical protein